MSPLRRLVAAAVVVAGVIAVLPASADSRTRALPGTWQANWNNGWSSMASLWVRADPKYITIGTGVSTWTAIVGTNFVQATGSKQPSYQASNANLGGQPAVSTVAASAQLMTSATTVAQPCTILFVGYESSTSDATVNNEGAEFPYNYIQASGAGNNASSVTISGGATAAAVASVLNGASSVVYGDLSSNVSSAGNPGSNGFTGVVLAQITGVSTYTGTYGEILLVPFAMSASQVSRVFAAWGQRYNQTWH